MGRIDGGLAGGGFLHRFSQFFMCMCPKASSVYKTVKSSSILIFKLGPTHKTNWNILTLPLRVSLKTTIHDLSVSSHLTQPYPFDGRYRHVSSDAWVFSGIWTYYMYAQCRNNKVFLHLKKTCLNRLTESFLIYET